MAKDRTGESKSDKLADQAVSILMGSKIKKTKGDEVGTAVKRLDAKVGKILAERALTRDEERLFRKEWMDLIEEARQLERALAKDVKDLEDILEAARRELGIRSPVQA